MTDKEQIMINGVDVRECEYLTYQLEEDGQYYWFCKISPTGGPDECEYNPECFYKRVLKQLVRKTQECEELKRKLSNQEQLYQNEIEIYNQSCLQLRQENDDLYLERLALNTANSGINALLEVKEQECDRYRKALEEIEKVINNILNSCLGRNTVSCRPAHNVCGDLINILDIINKAKGEDNAIRKYER